MLKTKEALKDPFKPLTEEFLQDPYPFYKGLRDVEPVFWSEPGNYWLLTGYREVDTILRDITFSKQWFKAAKGPFQEWQDPGLVALLKSRSKWILNQDPPDHTRLRGLVNKAFTPATIEKLRPFVQSIADSLLDQSKGVGTMDLVSDFAYPLPVVVIAQLLGVPAEDQHLFKRWSHALAQTVDIAAKREHLELAQQTTLEVYEYLRPLVNQRRTDPKDDLISALVFAEENGNKLTEEELLANCVLILLAGHETTVNLIGNAILALLRNPDQLSLLRKNPEAITTAADEFLRYDSSVQTAIRLATVDTKIGGKTIKAGDLVTLVLGAANRDPEQFDHPDTLDILRTNNKHLSFGGGIHYCLGTSLARVEAQIAIASLVQKAPNLKLLDEKPEYKPNGSLRGVKSLSLSL